MLQLNYSATIAQTADRGAELVYPYLNLKYSVYRHTLHAQFILTETKTRLVMQQDYSSAAGVDSSIGMFASTQLSNTRACSCSFAQPSMHAQSRRIDLVGKLSTPAALFVLTSQEQHAPRKPIWTLINAPPSSERILNRRRRYSAWAEVVLYCMGWRRFVWPSLARGPGALV